MINYEFKQFITTQEDVTNELKKIIDLKSLREFEAEDFTNIVIQYYMKYKELVFDEIGEDILKFKVTPHIRLGKKRIKIIGTCFENKGIAKLIDPKEGILKTLKKFDSNLS